MSLPFPEQRHSFSSPHDYPADSRPYGQGASTFSGRPVAPPHPPLFSSTSDSYARPPPFEPQPSRRRSENDVSRSGSQRPTESAVRGASDSPRPSVSSTPERSSGTIGRRLLRKKTRTVNTTSPDTGSSASTSMGVTPTMTASPPPPAPLPFPSRPTSTSYSSGYFPARLSHQRTNSRGSSCHSVPSSPPAGPDRSRSSFSSMRSNPSRLEPTVEDEEAQLARIREESLALERDRIAKLEAEEEERLERALAESAASAEQDRIRADGRAQQRRLEEELALREAMVYSREFEQAEAARIERERRRRTFEEEKEIQRALTRSRNGTRPDSSAHPSWRETSLERTEREALELAMQLSLQESGGRLIGNGAAETSAQAFERWSRPQDDDSSPYDSTSLPAATENIPHPLFDSASAHMTSPFGFRSPPRHRSSFVVTNPDPTVISDVDEEPPPPAYEIAYEPGGLSRRAGVETGPTAFTTPSLPGQVAIPTVQSGSSSGSQGRSPPRSPVQALEPAPSGDSPSHDDLGAENDRLGPSRGGRLLENRPEPPAPPDGIEDGGEDPFDDRFAETFVGDDEFREAGERQDSPEVCREENEGMRLDGPDIPLESAALPTAAPRAFLHPAEPLPTPTLLVHSASPTSGDQFKAVDADATFLETSAPVPVRRTSEPPPSMPSLLAASDPVLLVPHSTNATPIPSPSLDANLSNPSFGGVVQDIGSSSFAAGDHVLEGIRWGFVQVERASMHPPLDSKGAFPRGAQLSSAEREAGKQAFLSFAIEAKSWDGLLIFLTWFGKSRIEASPHDHGVDEADQGHQVAIRLEFFRSFLDSTCRIRCRLELLPHASSRPLSLDTASVHSSAAETTPAFDVDCPSIHILLAQRPYLPLTLAALATTLSNALSHSRLHHRQGSRGASSTALPNPSHQACLAEAVEFLKRLNGDDPRTWTGRDCDGDDSEGLGLRDKIKSRLLRKKPRVLRTDQSVSNSNSALPEGALMITPFSLD
ncbi:hypothetical protein JCM10212_004751 [Sporobolomyces blumeae]